MYPCPPSVLDSDPNVLYTYNATSSLFSFPASSPLAVRLCMRAFELSSSYRDIRSTHLRTSVDLHVHVWSLDSLSSPLLIYYICAQLPSWSAEPTAYGYRYVYVLLLRRLSYLHLAHNCTIGKIFMYDHICAVGVFFNCPIWIERDSLRSLRITVGRPNTVGFARACTFVRD